MTSLNTFIICSQQHVHIFEKCFTCGLTLPVYFWLSTFWKECLSKVLGALSGLLTSIPTGLI